MTLIEPIPNDSFDQTQKGNTGFSGLLFLGQIFCGVIEFGIFIPQVRTSIPSRHVTDELLVAFIQQKGENRFEVILLSQFLFQGFPHCHNGLLLIGIGTPTLLDYSCCCRGKNLLKGTIWDGVAVVLDGDCHLAALVLVGSIDEQMIYDSGVRFTHASFQDIPGSRGGEICGKLCLTAACSCNQLQFPDVRG